MSQLQPIVQNNQRVLTTAQIAESFGVDAKIVNRNFQRNSERYIQGKHYFALSGNDLKEFKGSRQFDDNLKFTSVLYLWTEKGAWLHAKSLNTDQAWDAYEMLVDDYYEIKNNVVPLNEKQSLIAVLKLTTMTAEETEELKQVTTEHSNEIKILKQKVDNEITLDHGEQRRLQKAVSIKAYELCNDPAERPQYFREIYREIKDRFAVASYKDVKRHELQSAIRYVENWIPRKVS